MARWGHDFLPYRDYFLQAPPGVPILVQIISMVGGPHLLGTLTFGALLRIGGACALYGMLVTIARPPYAAVATLTALFVSSTDISDTPFYYNHIGAAMVLIGTYLGLRGAQGNRPKHYLALGASGALLMYAVTVKQTMIFGAAASVVALVVLLLPRPPAGWVRWLASLLPVPSSSSAGCGPGWRHMISVGSFLFVFRRAPEGKGGIARSLLRPVTLLFEVQLREALEASVAAWLVIAIIATIWVLHRRGAHFRRDVVLLLILLCGGLEHLRGLLVGAFHDVVPDGTGMVGQPGPRRAASSFPARGGDRSRRASPRRAGCPVVRHRLLLCRVVAVVREHCVSRPGVVVAAILERPPSNARTRWVASVLVLALASMYLAVDRKFESPHSWGLWYEPPLYEPRGRFVHPVLAGMRTSEISSELYAAVAQVARERTKPDDRMVRLPQHADPLRARGTPPGDVLACALGRHLSRLPRRGGRGPSEGQSAEDDDHPR